jgi:hypothetical protein
LQLRPEWVSEFRSEFMAAAVQLHEALARSARERATDALVKRTERQIAKALLAQGMGLVKRLPAIQGRWAVGEALRQAQDPVEVREALIDADWGPLWDEAAGDGDDLIEEAIVGAAKAALRAGAESLLGVVAKKTLVQYGISWTLENPAAVAYLEAHGAELVSRIDEATRGDLRSLIEAAMREGRTYDQLADDIQKQFQHYGDPDSYWRFDASRPQAHIDSRAHLIAVTEIGEAYEDGELQAAREMQAAGLTVVKWWSTMGDDRVSELCLGNEADGEIPLDEPHTSGHMHPLGHPACRCTENYDVKLEAGS